MKLDFDKYPIFSLAAEGGMGFPEIAEGRLFPYLILNTVSDSRIGELIRLHLDTPPGDTHLHWNLPLTLFAPKHIVLKITFIKPMAITFGIEFILEKHYGAIDGIVHSRGFYLQDGKPGDKVSKQFQNPHILVEVPDMGIDARWNSILINFLKNKLKKEGASKKEANKLTEQHIKSMRQFWQVRTQSP